MISQAWILVDAGGCRVRWSPVVVDRLDESQSPQRRVADAVSPEVAPHRWLRLVPAAETTDQRSTA
jgi:hypothetical protein